MAIDKLRPYFASFCVWRTGPPRGGKLSKIPINPNTGAPAKTNDATTFGTYDEAQAALAGGQYDGLGVLMASGGDTVLIDIDGCLDEIGKPDALAQVAIDKLGGVFCEVSQSGRGLHFIMRGALPDWVTREKLTIDGHSVEVYSRHSTRFICLTGNELYEADVVENQASLEMFLRKFGFDAEAKAPGAPRVSGGNADTDTETDTDSDTDGDVHGDEEIVKLLRQNNKRGKITRLLAGDLKDYGGDHSAADLALCSEIAFYVKDADQIARIFETSKLNRDKWQERPDYRDRTLCLAIDGCKGDYFEGRNGKGAAESAMGAALVAAQSRYGDMLSGGIEGLAVSPKGRLLPTINNTIQVLLRDHRSRGVIGFNLFSGMAEVVRPLRDVFGPAASTGLGEFVESDITAIRAWLGREYGLEVSKHDAFDSVQAWARHTEWNPVTDALSAARDGWDGVRRLDTWLADYLGVDVTESAEYYKAIGHIALIGAVARAFEPACKLDTIFILQGVQGCFKSRAIKTMCDAICPQAFAENIPVIGESKETALALRGMWIVSLDELTSMRKSEAEHVKSFISAQSDRGRVPYGRAFENWPRRCAFFGSTNETEWLSDVSGGRRFLICKVGKIDIDRLQRDMRQLWAEAVIAYERGEKWFLAEAVALSQAADHQKSIQTGDSWDDAIADFLLSWHAKDKPLFHPWELFELYSAVFPHSQVDQRNFPQIEQKRFAARLRHAGFESKKVSGGRKRWVLTTERSDALIRASLPSDPKETDWGGMGRPLGAPKISVFRSAAA